MKINSLALAVSLSLGCLPYYAQAFTSRVDGFTVSDEHVFSTSGQPADQFVTNGVINNGSISDYGNIYLSTNSQGNNITVNQQGWLTVAETSSVMNSVVNQGGRLTLQNGGNAQNTWINDGGYMDMAAYTSTSGELHIAEEAELFITTVDERIIDVTSNQPAPPANIRIENMTVAGQVEIGPSWSPINGENDGDAPLPAKPGPKLVTRIGTLVMQPTSKVTFVPYKSGMQFNRLEIENLSGHGYFRLTSSLADNLSDSLYVSGQATGQFGLWVVDSGREITHPTNIPLVYINSGDATFELLNLNGIIDGGVYHYSLYDRSANGHREWYLASSKDGVVQQPENDIGENSNNEAVNPQPQPPLTPETPQTPETPKAPTPTPTPTPTPSLTASAQGVLSMAAVSQHILNTELSTLRQRMGNLRGNEGDVGVWARYLSDDSRLNDHRYTAFNNTLNGLQIGADRRLDFLNGEFLLGAFTSYSKSNVKFNNAGGNGDVTSYGGGLYATYLDRSGFYLDGVLKGNHLNNQLRPQMNSGRVAKGEYDQKAMTASLEAGYTLPLSPLLTLEPYAKVSYTRIGGADYGLNNGMQAHLDAANGLQGELGTLFGANFVLNGVEVMPYAKLAIAREFIKRNDLSINNIAFDNDYSGNVGKYGLGVNASITKNTALYAEVDYLNGNKLETPLTANAGFRIQF